ncbi:hypothetical protein GW17_00020042 [Ensete ventricosum]|nr:hypothetical protein GW17_00020042 [Ensete ventricosum]
MARFYRSFRPASEEDPIFQRTAVINPTKKRDLPNNYCFLRAPRTAATSDLSRVGPTEYVDIIAGSPPPKSRWLPRRASDGVARSVCRVKQKRIRKAFFRLSTTNVIKLRYLRYDIIYETVLLLLAHFKKRIEPSASLFAGGIDGGRRLWFLATLVLTLTTAVAAVEEAPASRRHAYAAMMYMGTPRDYEFYVATRVMMRSLAKLNVDADLVVIASVDVPARWVQTL